jgi:hypothetical protein
LKIPFSEKKKNKKKEQFWKNLPKIATATYHMKRFFFVANSQS